MIHLLVLFPYFCALSISSLKSLFYMRVSSYFGKSLHILEEDFVSSYSCHFGFRSSFPLWKCLWSCHGSLFRSYPRSSLSDSNCVDWRTADNTRCEPLKLTAHNNDTHTANLLLKYSIVAILLLKF